MIVAVVNYHVTQQRFLRSDIRRQIYEHY